METRDIFSNNDSNEQRTPLLARRRESFHRESTSTGYETGPFTDLRPTDFYTERTKSKETRFSSQDQNKHYYSFELDEPRTPGSQADSLPNVKPSLKMSTDMQWSHILMKQFLAAPREESRAEVKSDRPSCELVLSHVNPFFQVELPTKDGASPQTFCQLDLIAKSMTAETALIRYENELYFYDKKTNTLYPPETENDEEALRLFDLRFHLTNSNQKASPQTTTRSFTKPRALTYDELLQIRSQWGIGPAIKFEMPPETSAWRQKNGVDLIEMDALYPHLNPAYDDLSELPFLNAAYLRCQGQLWYVKRLNPLQKWLSRFGLVKERQLLLAKVDDQFAIDAQKWEREHIIHTYEDPSTVDLDTLNFTEAAYLRHKGQLWYVKRLSKLQKFLSFFGLVKDRRCIINDHALERFDDALRLEKHYQHLSDAQIAMVGLLSKHTHRTAWQQFLHYFASFCVGFIAIGCGISTAATFIGLNLVTGGLATLIAAIFFITGVAVNLWIFKRAASPVLISLFGREKFLVDEDGNPLSPKKKFAMVLAVLFSLSVGITFAGLTYVSTLALPLTFGFLGAISVALPPVAALLATVTAICMTALMLKDIAELIKNKNIQKQIKSYFITLVSTSQNIPHNQGKSPPRIVLERASVILLTLALVPLAILGLYMTMNACVPGVTSLLGSVGLASAVALGPAFLGQVPFGVQTVCQTIDKVVFGISDGIASLYEKLYSLATGKKTQQDQQAHPSAVIESGEVLQPDTTAEKIVKVLCAIGNGVGNGVIAMAGAVGALWTWLGFSSGFANSASAGVPAVLDKKTYRMRGQTEKALGESPDISNAISQEALSHFKPMPGSQDDAGRLVPKDPVSRLARSEQHQHAVATASFTALTLGELKKSDSSRDSTPKAVMSGHEVSLLEEADTGSRSKDKPQRQFLYSSAELAPSASELQPGKRKAPLPYASDDTAIYCRSRRSAMGA